MQDFFHQQYLAKTKKELNKKQTVCVCFRVSQRPLKQNKILLVGKKHMFQQQNHHHPKSPTSPNPNFSSPTPSLPALYIYIDMGVSKNSGVSPKMDGLFHGNPYFLMDDMEGKTHHFRKHPYIYIYATMGTHDPRVTFIFRGYNLKPIFFGGVKPSWFPWVLGGPRV